MISEFSPVTAEQRLARYEALYYGIDAFALVAEAHGRAKPLRDADLVVDNALQQLLSAQIRFAKAQLAAAQAAAIGTVKAAETQG
jgi:hypothetical protein